MSKHDSEKDAFKRYEQLSLVEAQGRLAELQQADRLSQGQRTSRRRLMKVVETKEHAQQMNRLRQIQSAEWRQQQYDEGYERGGGDRRNMRGHRGNQAEGVSDVWHQGYDDGYMYKMRKTF